MTCLNLCESHFTNIYSKIDRLSEIRNITILTNLTRDIEIYSREFVNKLQLKLFQISHQHARLDATSTILMDLLKQDDIVTYSGINLYEFLVLILIAFSVGYFIELFRILTNKNICD